MARKRRSLSPSLAVLAAGFALWITFRDIPPAHVFGLIAHAGWFAPLVLLPQLLSLSAETLAWQCVFSRLGRPVNFRSLLGVRVITEAVGRTLPAGAVLCESMKPALLAARGGVPLTDAIAAMAGRKFLVLLSHAAYLVLALALGYGALERASTRFGWGPALVFVLFTAAVALACGAIFMSSALRNGSVARKALDAAMRIPGAAWRCKVRAHYERLRRTDGRFMQVFEKPTEWAGWPAAACMASWLFEALESYLILRLVGIELSFSTVLATEASVSFARHLLAVLPAGVGVQDIGYAAFLGALGIPDALTSGAAFALLKRAKEAFWAAVGFTLWFFGSPSVRLPAPMLVEPPVAAE